MTYVKLPKTVRDHAVGFQSLNQANDNGEAVLDIYELKHLVPTSATAGSPFWQRNVPGKHNDILIARATADFFIDSTSGITPSLGASLSGGIFGTIAPQRIGTGQWRIYLATSQNFFCVATPRATTGVERKATCFISSGPSGSLVIVSTWERAPSWARTDFNFSLAVWGERPST
jgi:hypothetical protein